MGRDEGLWQINSVHGYAARCTLQARCNADLAFALYEADGRSFSSWTTYESGRYMAFIERAHAAAGSLERSDGAWICPVDPRFASRTTSERRVMEVAITVTRATTSSRPLGHR